MKNTMERDGLTLIAFGQLKNQISCIPCAMTIQIGAWEGQQIQPGAWDARSIYWDWFLSMYKRVTNRWNDEWRKLCTYVAIPIT